MRGMNQTIDMLGKLMDATALRQKVISNNLANVNTPGYVRKDVKFVDTLTKAIKGGRTEINEATFEVTEDKTASVDARGNSVTLQKEVAEIAQNELLYNFAAEMTSQKFAGLRKAISGTK
jgi:flagellar basal-body rod protein FlgB